VEESEGGLPPSHTDQYERKVQSAKSGAVIDHVCVSTAGAAGRPGGPGHDQSGMTNTTTDDEEAQAPVSAT